MGLDLAGTGHGARDVIGQQIGTGSAALIVGEFAGGGLAPVLVVDLEDTVIVGAIGVGGSNHIGAVGALVLGNAGPLRQLRLGHTQSIHLLGQGATGEGLAEGRSNHSQSG